MDSQRDSVLAQRLISGDSKAHDLLMDLYYQSLCNYAQSLCHDHYKAEDIIQNVFVKIWTNRKKINPELSIKSYLYKSAYNEFIDQCRKNKSLRYLDEKYFEAVDLVSKIEDKEMDDLIKLMNVEIENLPSKCKEIFLMNKKEGLTHTEIAEYLNISTKTIEGHMTRAFKILAEKLNIKMKVLLFFTHNIKKHSENFV
ncbi:RNA polymerase sigma factor [Formosa sp. 3Alg 14/1]|uniref:RNA polymerase sigma factor n=1 Tax=Formosa sp. 3Alg 14/1 TaxID=3382190 RepID=UPI0039BDF876